MVKTGLVLEGGAKRGIYTAGVLDVLLENGIKVDGVIGVSAGAIHGCSYVSEQIGRSIRFNMDYGNDWRFMSFRSWLVSGDVVNAKFCYHTLPEKLCPFDNAAFVKSKTDFYVVCSNVETGQAEYVQCYDMFQDIEYLRASTSLPIFSRIVKIQDKKFLDGGICDSIPLKAFQSLGYDKNIVIETRPQGYQKKKFALMWLVKLLYSKYPNFIKAVENRHKMYNDELKYVEEEARKGRTLVIRPSRLINISKMERNLEIVKEMYELGRKDALEKLAEIKAFVAK